MQLYGRVINFSQLAAAFITQTQLQRTLTLTTTSRLVNFGKLVADAVDGKHFPRHDSESHEHQCKNMSLLSALRICILKGTGILVRTYIHQ